MKQTKAIILTLVIMALSLVGLYACGGESPTPTPIPPTATVPPPTATTPPATPTTAAAPATATTGTSGTGGTSGSGGSLSSDDQALIQSAVNSVDTLQSYHFTIDIAASDYVTRPVKAEGDYVAPNTTYVKGTVGDQPFEEVVVGDHLFQKDASGNWAETQKQPSTSGALFDPQQITSSGNPLGGIGGMFKDIKTFKSQGTDSVNGTSVNKYSFSLDIAEMMAAEGQDVSSLGVDISKLGSLGGGNLYIDPQGKNLHRLDIQLNLGPLMQLMALAFANIGGTPTPGGPQPTPMPQLPVNVSMTISKHNSDTLPIQLTDAMKQAQQGATETATPEQAATPAEQPTTDTSGSGGGGGGGTGTGTGQVVNGNIGDTLTLGDTALTVNSVKRTTDGNLPPTSGNEYAILTVTVENKGTQDLTLSGLLSFGLKDSSGADQQYAIGAKYTNMFDTVTNGKPIAAGSKVTGELGYEVKQGDKNLTLKFTPDFLNSGNYITVKIDQ